MQLGQTSMLCWPLELQQKIVDWLQLYIFIDRVIFMTYHCNPKNESGMVNLATDYLFLIRFLL